MYRSADGGELRARARLTVLCDGMHSNLRAKVSVPKITPTAFEAAVTLTGCHLQDRNLVQVLAEQPCVSLYPISSSEVGPPRVPVYQCVPCRSPASASTPSEASPDCLLSVCAGVRACTHARGCVNPKGVWWLNGVGRGGKG